MARYTPDNTRGRQIQVFLDGVPQQRVIEADDALGFIVVMDKNLKRRLLLGNVTVAFPDDPCTS